MSERENGDEAPIGEADWLRARARGAVGVVRNEGVDADDELCAFIQRGGVQRFLQCAAGVVAIADARGRI